MKVRKDSRSRFANLAILGLRKEIGMRVTDSHIFHRRISRKLPEFFDAMRLVVVAAFVSQLRKADVWLHLQGMQRLLKTDYRK